MTDQRTKSPKIQTLRHNDERIESRALPLLVVPRLGQLGFEHLLQGQLPLAALFVGRMLASVALWFVAAGQGWTLVLVATTWLIYSSTLTTVHHLIHGGLGMTQRSRRFWLSVAGMMVLESGHALQQTHLAHHRSDPTAPDPEGYIEGITWGRLAFEMWIFRYRMMLWGLRRGRNRNRIAFEVAVHVAVHIAAVLAVPHTLVPLMFVLLTQQAAASFAVFASRGPQTNWGRSTPTPLVRVKARWARIPLFSHDLHLEHHAYPKVPMPRLRELADAVGPALVAQGTHDVRLP